MSIRPFFLVVFLTILTSALLFWYSREVIPPYLTFSDAAKFADIARNLLNGNGYKSSFSYSDQSGGIPELSNGFFNAFWVPPLFPVYLSLVFRLLGISDSSVIVSSSILFIFTVLLLFALAKRLYDDNIAFLSAIAVASHAALLGYATQGASETLLMLEIVGSYYLATFNSPLANILSLLLGVSMYFTRPQGFIYIFSLIIFMLLSKQQNYKKLLVGLLLTFALFGFFERYTLSHNTVNFIYSITTRGITTLPLFSKLVPNNNELRGGQPTITFRQAVTHPQPYISKSFYNLYNFYKLLPQIASPYLIAFFLLALVAQTENRTLRAFKISTTIALGLTMLVTSLSIPLIRYLHPVIPLVYPIAIATLVRSVRSLLPNSPEAKVIAFSLVLVVVYTVGQTLGTIFLDSRFQRNHLNNFGKPPVYFSLSQTLLQHSRPEDIVITNLDTWGSWYTGRRTVWFPLNPSQLEPNTGGRDADVIFLSTYKADDPNYLMGKNWREIIIAPLDLKFDYLKNNYTLTAKFTLKPQDNFENQEIEAVLFTKTNNVSR